MKLDTDYWDRFLALINVQDDLLSQADCRRLVKLDNNKNYCCFLLFSSVINFSTLLKKKLVAAISGRQARAIIRPPQTGHRKEHPLRPSSGGVETSLAGLFLLPFNLHSN